MPPFGFCREEQPQSFTIDITDKEDLCAAATKRLSHFFMCNTCTNLNKCFTSVYTQCCAYNRECCPKKMRH